MDQSHLRRRCHSRGLDPQPSVEVRAGLRELRANGQRLGGLILAAAPSALGRSIQ